MRIPHVRALIGSVLAGAVLLGCHAPDIARYDGSVTSSTSDASAVVALTVYSRADSVITGYLSSGASLVPSGHFVGVRTPTGWRIQSHTEQGDTLSWTTTPAGSTPSGTALAGTYRVVTGDRAGDGGTFELRQSWGRGLELPGRASSNLRTAGLTLEPPIVLLVAAAMVTLFFLLIGWVQAAPPTTPPAAPRTPVARDLTGIGGWLALFLIGQSITLLIAAANTGEAVTPLFGGTWVLAGAIPWMRGLLVAEGVAHVLRTLITAVAIVATIKRWPGAPRLWFALLSLLGLYGALDVVGVQAVNDAMHAMLGSAFASVSDEQAKATTLNLRLVAFAIIWCSYWARSERVRLTFGRRALDDWRVGIGRWPRWGGRGGRANPGLTAGPVSEGIAPGGSEAIGLGGE